MIAAHTDLILFCYSTLILRKLLPMASTSTSRGLPQEVRPSRKPIYELSLDSLRRRPSIYVIVHIYSRVAKMTRTVLPLKPSPLCLYALMQPLQQQESIRDILRSLNRETRDAGTDGMCCVPNYNTSGPKHRKEEHYFGRLLASLQYTANASRGGRRL